MGKTFALTALLLIGVPDFSSGQGTEKEAVRDTIFYLSPVIINPTEARERETPATFSNLSQQQLTERYSVQDVPVLLSELPSMTYYSENGNGIGYNYINLRGFDQRRLSVMINGVPQNDPEDHNVYWIDFPDLMASIGNVQVQRGAGSAFYGPPAIGGSINLVTNPFSRKPGISFGTMLGFQEFGDSGSSFLLTTRKYEATINSGLIEREYMLYGKLGKILSSGYRTNSWVEMDSYFLGAVRLDKTMTTRINFFGGPISDGLAYNGLPKFAIKDKKLRRQNIAYWELDSAQETFGYLTMRRPEEAESFAQPHYELIHEWRLSTSLTLINTLFYYAGEGYYDYDASWADTSMLRIGYNYGIPAAENPANTLVRAFVGNRQWGWLPRIEIEHQNGSLILGAEARLHRSTHWGKIEFADGLPPSLSPGYHFYEYNGKREILSLYAHELLHPGENLTLLLDIQLVHNRYAIENEKYLGNSFNLPYFFANPRIGINYNVSAQLNGYFSAALTSREPRMRNLYAAEDSYLGAMPQFRADTSSGRVRYDFGEPLAKPERLLDLEAGVGLRTLSARLAANIFWMEFTDELVKSGQVDIFGQPVTGNAGRTRHLGFELDGSLSLSGPFELAGNISLSGNHLVHYTIIDGNEIKKLDGNPIAGFPDMLGNLRCTYRKGYLAASVAAKYVGSFYTDNFKNEENNNPAYTVFDAQFIYRLTGILGLDLRARCEVHNILNNLYSQSGEGNSFFPAAERNYLFGISADL